MIQIENQTKYGLIKEVNFTINLFKKWLKDKGIEMYRYIMKENMSLLKDV